MPDDWPKLRPKQQKLKYYFMFTLRNETIQTIKIWIAKIDSILPEDITDQEVFQYLNDKEEEEQELSINKHNSKNIDDWTYEQPRTKSEIAYDIYVSVCFQYSYLAHI